MADPFIVDAPLAVGGTGFRVDSPLADPAKTRSINEAIWYGVQSSATGLAARGKLPTQVLDTEAPWYHRLAANAAGMVTDLPLSVAAGVPGFAAGGPIGAGAAGFAAPMALRDALMQAYQTEHAVSWSDAWDIAKAGVVGGVKGAVIGGATMGAGRVVAPLVPGGALAKGAAATGAELATMTSTAALLEGHLPSAQDFMDNAILLGGLKGAVAVAGKLRTVYAETGKTPAEVRADAAADPTIAAELRGEPASKETVLKALVGEAAEGATEGAKRDYPIALKDGTQARLEFQDYSGDVNFKVFNAAGERVGGGGFVPAEGKSGRWEGHYFVEEAFRRKGVMTAVFDTFESVTGQKLQASASASADALAFWKSRPSESQIPSAYAPLALEERIKAAIQNDPRPELIRQTLDNKRQNIADVAADSNRYDYIADKDVAAAVLRATTELYQKEITNQTRGVVPNKATAIEALRMVSDGNIGEHVVGAAGNAAEIYARAHMLRGASNHAVAELNKIADVPPGELTPMMKLKALSALEGVAQLKAEIEGIGAEAGRSLQILGAIKRDPSFLGDANTLLALAERKGPLQDIAALARAFKDPAQMAKFAREYTKATTTEKVLEAWKAAILSGPQTHLANILGNLMKWGVELPESALAATFTAADRALRGDPLTMAQYKARALAPLYGLQFGAKDALSVAAEVWKQKGERLEKADVYRTAIEGKAGDVVRLPFRFLQVEDALFRTVAERAEAHIMAVDRASKGELSPGTKEYAAQIQAMVENPAFGLTEKAGFAAIERVQNAGAEAVFSQRLGPRMETLQRAMAGHWSQLVIPFVRTPANLISWTVQHTPLLNLASARWRNDWSAGGESQARAVSRVLIGTGIAATAYSFAQDGLLSGGGIFDKEMAGTRAAAGQQPYSIKVGDKWYSYQRIEPVAKLLGIAADLVELSRSPKLSEDDQGKAAMLLVMLFGNATISTTYLSGLANVMQAVTDPERYGDKWAEQYASSLVPKIVGQTAAMIDPHKREVDGAIDAIQAQIPYLREQLLPKRDVWGEPAKSERLFGFMPVTTTKESEDLVRTEALRLAVGIADVPKFIREAGPFAEREKRVKMTEEQRDVMREVSGTKAMEILAPIVNAPDWDRIPDFAKVAIYKDVIEGSRKQGQYAALPPDAAERQKLRQKIVDKIIQQTQAVGAK